VLSTLGLASIIPIILRTDSGWAFTIPLAITGCGLGLLVSQLNNYTLAPIDETHVSEAAGVNSAAGSFGLSFGLAMAGGVMLAVLAFSFTNLTEQSTVIHSSQKQQIYSTLEDNAEVMSNTQLNKLLVGQPKEVQKEITSINSEARNRSLQAALLIPIFAGIIGIFNSFRMMKLPDIKPSKAAEGASLG
jgi:hypothetical protein